MSLVFVKETGNEGEIRRIAFPVSQFSETSVLFLSGLTLLRVASGLQNTAKTIPVYIKGKISEKLLN